MDARPRLWNNSTNHVKNFQDAVTKYVINPLTSNPEKISTLLMEQFYFVCWLFQGDYENLKLVLEELYAYKNKKETIYSVFSFNKNNKPVLSPLRNVLTLDLIEQAVSNPTFKSTWNTFLSTLYNNETLDKLTRMATGSNIEECVAKCNDASTSHDDSEIKEIQTKCCELDCFNCLDCGQFNGTSYYPHLWANLIGFSLSVSHLIYSLAKLGGNYFEDNSLLSWDTLSFVGTASVLLTVSVVTARRLLETLFKTSIIVPIAQEIALDAFENKLGQKAIEPDEKTDTNNSGLRLRHGATSPTP